MKIIFRSLTFIYLLAGWSCQTKPKQEAADTSAMAAVDTAQLLAKRPVESADRSAADRLIRALYFENDGDLNPFYQKTDRAQVDRFFDKTLAELIWAHSSKMSKKPAINGLFNAPDAAVKKRWVLPAVVIGPKAAVYVTFLNAGKPTELRLDMREVSKGRWRITDMIYADGSRLTQLMN